SEGRRRSARRVGQGSGRAVCRHRQRQRAAARRKRTRVGAGELGPDPAPGRGLGRAGWACGRSYFYDRRTAGGRKPSSADFGAAGQPVGVWNIGGRAAPCQPFGTLSGTDPESGKYLFWRLSLGIRPGAAANGRGSGRAPAFFGEKREKRRIRSGKIGEMIHCFSAAKCVIL